MSRLLLPVATLAVAAVWAQTQPKQAPQAPTSGARDLFYFGAHEKDELPPISKTPPPATNKKSPAAGQKRPAPPPSSAAGAPHLGLRYTLLLVKGNRSDAVDPDRNFRRGDCVAIEFEANRSGYLYVLAKESSGNWHTLFPSEELADERNVIDPGQKIRTPRTTCFEIDDPPGTETLFVALSRAPRDIADLQESINGSPGKVTSTVEQLDQSFGTRDLAIRRPSGQAAAPKESSEQAVYVVTSSNKPASTVVTKVEIRHR
jgi:hypothetical protein